MHKYPSDITREQFSGIRHILEKARRITKPITVDLYDVFCTILYILKSGYQWRMLPKDYPKWQTVYSYFSLWEQSKNNRPSLLARALKKSMLKSIEKHKEEIQKPHFALSMLRV
jgi:transposase